MLTLPSDKSRLDMLRLSMSAFSESRSENCLTLLILLTSLQHSLTEEKSFDFSSLSESRLLIHDGKLREILVTGNS